MSAYRLTQILGIILILVAGYLWTQRLGEQVFTESLHNRSDSIADQLELVQAKVDLRDDPLELLEFGRKFLKAGNPEFAAVALERATKLNPKYRDAWFLLGYSEIQIGNSLTDPRQESVRQEHFDKARLALEKAHEIDPSHQATINLLKGLGGLK